MGWVKRFGAREYRRYAMCYRRFAYVAVTLIALLCGSFVPTLGQDARATCDLVLDFIPDFPGLAPGDANTINTFDASSENAVLP